MTALAQGSAGVALVMGFALLRTGQVGSAAILLAVQSASVALTAMILRQPLLALPPLLLAQGFWLLRHQTPMFRAETSPLGGAKLGIGAGAVLAVLCQSQGAMALPCSVLLLAMLLAATRSHPLMQVAALVAAQNGVTLAASLMAGPLTLEALPGALLVPVACLLLPVPLAAGLLGSALAALGPATQGRWRFAALPAAALGWIDVGVAVLILVLAVIVPVDSLGSVFAPLLGLDAVIRAVVRRGRPALGLVRRGAALLQTGLMVLAVGTPHPVAAWLAVLGAMAMALLPALSRRWSPAALAFLGAGFSLFGMLLPGSGIAGSGIAGSGIPASVLAGFGLFAGLAMIAATVPDLAVVVVIMMLRRAIAAPWPPSVEALGIGIAVLGLLSCAVLLAGRGSAHRVTLLVLAQASLAALMIATGSTNGRFAALVLLVLLILSRAAVRSGGGAMGLAGLPPFGVFPGMVLVVLTLAEHDPWLLLPVGVGMIPVILAGVPGRLPDMRLSVGWLPWLLAAAVGWLAPPSLVHWCHLLTAGPP